MSVPDNGSYSPSVWTVVFIGRRSEAWFDWLSPFWARHVLAFGYVIPAKAWVVVDPTEEVHRVRIVPDGDMSGWIALVAEAGCKALRIEQGPGGKYNARLGNWCTQTIARLIGLKSSALRPVALYRDLLRAGAYPVLEERDVDQDESPFHQGRPDDRPVAATG
jgi:hypothetical protein